MSQSNASSLKSGLPADEKLLIVNVNHVNSNWLGLIAIAN